MAGQQPNQTLQATALVHEAYLRLVGSEESDSARWDSRGHFFAAAAEAMRWILIDRARRTQSLKRGGDMARTTWEESKVGAAAEPVEILAVDEALTKLTALDPELAKVVKLHYFVGMTVPDTAAAHRRSAMGGRPRLAIPRDCGRMGMTGFRPADCRAKETLQLSEERFPDGSARRGRSRANKWQERKREMQ